MTTKFLVAPGSLPELRFGARYRMRARAVDLAGNSLAPASTLPKNLDPAAPQGTTFPYQRFEPVGAPTLLLTAPASAGAGLLRLVIRSQNSSEALDTVPTTQSDTRHLVPPRISARLAEQHGLLDAPNGHLRSDAALFGDIIARDKFAYPEQGGVPVVTTPLATVGYLPDPLARGVALRDLPNTLDNTQGRISGTALGYSVLPDVQPRAGSVTYVDFGSAWPDRAALRLMLVEGSAAPAWNAATRTLTVALPKGASPDVDLSCYSTAADLTLIGVWGWLTDYFAAAEQSGDPGGNAGLALGNAADATALITRLVLEGGHAMITPAVTVTLVHAVQQPLGRPEFQQLPVIHQPSSPTTPPPCATPSPLSPPGARPRRTRRRCWGAAQQRRYQREDRARGEVARGHRPAVGRAADARVAQRARRDHLPELRSTAACSTPTPRDARGGGLRCAGRTLWSPLPSTCSRA